MPAAAREELAVPGVARRQHAVEHVDAAGDCRRSGPAGVPDPHQVARPLLGQHRGRRASSTRSRPGLGSPTARPADRVAREVELDERARALARAGRGGRRPARSRTATGPARSWASRLRRAQRVVRAVAASITSRGRVARRALVEGHRDVGAQVLLDLHRALGREQVLAAVDVAPEAHALLVELAQRGEREDLVAAAVGEERPVPAGEAVEARRGSRRARRPAAASGGRCSRAGCARRSRARSRCSTAFTAAAVPTGMKTGVSTSPCGVVQAARAGAPVARVDREREAGHGGSEYRLWPA